MDALVCEGLTYRYPGEERDAVTSVDLVVHPGRKVAVMGANGSGKSTLVLLLKGLLEPTSGTVSIGGLAPHDADPSRGGAPAFLGVGVVFQDPDNQIVATRVDEDVAFGPENLGVATDELRARVDDALAAVGMTDMASREPHTLSGGEKQRLALAGALALSPRFLLLDEPASMLDASSARALRSLVADLVRTRDVGVLEVVHDPELALDADEVVVLAGGAVRASGTPRQVLADIDLLEAAGLASLTAVRIAGALRAHGVDVSATALTAEEVLAAL
jgi:energy-coupling factor transport system ATP-binding protein